MKNVGNFLYLMARMRRFVGKNIRLFIDNKTSRFLPGYSSIILLVTVVFGSSLFAQSVSPGLIDLTVKNVEVITPQTFVGDWIKLRVTVENRGSADAPAFNVDLFKNPRNVQNLPAAGDLRHVVKALPKKSEIQIDYVFQAKFRSYNIYFKADATEAIKETSESNNIYGAVNIQVQQGERPDDQYEENDVIESAALITNGFYNLVSADDDYFSIKATTGQYIDVTALFDATAANLDVTLLDSAGNALVKSVTYFEKERVLYLVPESNKDKQTFIIHIASGGGRVEYTLDVRVRLLPELSVAIEGTPELYKEEIPTGEDLDEIYQLYQDDGFVLTDEHKALIKRNMTKYYYNVSVKIKNTGKRTDRPFYVDLFRTSRLTPAPGAYGEDWHIIYPGNFEKPDEPGVFLETIYKTMKIVVMPGSYTLYATADNDSNLQETDETNNISLPVELKAGNEIVEDDNFELNNVHPGVEITTGIYKNLTALDDDYFQIVIPPKKVLNVSIDFVHSLGDLDLYLYDDNEVSLIRSVGTSNREFISYFNTSSIAKTVTIRVDEVNQNIKYALNVNITSSYEVDLVVNQIGYAPITVSQGESLTATVQLENRGANDAFNVRV
ncbi:MAG: CARDB domain-containing protein, partial [Leptospirales bacterium]